MFLYVVFYDVLKFIYFWAFSLEQPWDMNSVLKAGHQEKSHLNQNMVSDIKWKMHFLKKNHN